MYIYIYICIYREREKEAPGLLDVHAPWLAVRTEGEAPLAVVLHEDALSWGPRTVGATQRDPTRRNQMK